LQTFQTAICIGTRRAAEAEFKLVLYVEARFFRQHICCMHKDRSAWRSCDLGEVFWWPTLADFVDRFVVEKI
jgi:hypothetical protein